MVSIDPIFLDFVPGASGSFPTLEDKYKYKGNKIMSFKLTVKDGDRSYDFDQKSGQYKTQTTDYVEEFTDFSAALQEFLVYLTDEYNENKVSLSFSPKKAKKNKK